MSQPMDTITDLIRPFFFLCQVGMSRPGTTVKPNLTEKEKKLLDVKYSIFNECIDLQRKWRKAVEDALK
jgi:hypothetical protein